MSGTHSETIVALSTPPGEAGIAVIRVSGAAACRIVSAVFRSLKGNTFDPAALEHRRLYHGRIVRPVANGGAETPVDECVLAVFRGPESYTGEDVVEVSCHGGPVAVAAVVSALHAAGARAAEPGEFTKRAFLNGKMDLIQAEAVADIIHARSELQHAAAQRQLAGGLSREIGELADQLVNLLADVEANIDFIEEGIDTVDYAAAARMTDAQDAALQTLLESARFTRPFRDGYQVVLAGPVNAGKSSLFNVLLGEGRAIVTDIPGTTRDVIREPLVLGGLVFVLHDTAGLRAETGDRVEAIGMGLTNEALRTADLVLFVVDGTAAPDNASLEALSLVPAERCIVALNKSDLTRGRGTQGVVARVGGYEAVAVSAVSGDGLDTLRSRMQERVGADALSRLARERFVLNGRVADLLRGAREHVAVLGEALEQRKPLELLAADIRAVLACYEEATGRRYSDRLIDAIFSRFCLGK